MTAGLPKEVLCFRKGGGRRVLRGIYAAGQGMAARLNEVDLVADNAANVQTPGFKGQMPVTGGFRSLLLARVRDGAVVPVGGLSPGAAVDETVLDVRSGPLEPREDPLAVAISGPGFFVVQTPQGLAYTRHGGFHQDEQGNLLTAAGQVVLGNQGPIRVEADAFVKANGDVVSGDRVVARLRVVDFPHPERLERLGDSLFRAGPEAGTPRELEPRLVPRFLEGANVNPVTEMVRLIELLRAYEACQKAVQVQDDTLGQAIRQVARV